MENWTINDFDPSEIARLIHHEQIGFGFLPKERKYLDAYREALKRHYGYGEPKDEPVEAVEVVEVEEPAPKKRRSTKRKTEEVVEETAVEEVVSEPTPESE